MKPFIATQLRILRESNHLTQKDMGHILHVQRQTYCNYEAGIRTPSLDSLVLVAQHFHVTLDSILSPDARDLPKQSSSYLYSHRDSIRLSQCEHQILKNIQELSSADQEKVMAFILFIKQQHDI
ncbi:MAG: helix-turn-helix transcriptional regulator [Lachnospiraceae bacterium]|nr:helix-turn-helix transcriptional regulator [Lachnospiraceae bacterium]